jgi:hypothetical protein
MESSKISISDIMVSATNPPISLEWSSIRSAIVTNDLLLLYFEQVPIVIPRRCLTPVAQARVFELVEEGGLDLTKEGQDWTELPGHQKSDRSYLL